jgi:hypothetical protein
MRKHQRHTQDDMLRHIEACKKSKQSQQAYCKGQGIAYSTFQYWTKKLREKFSTEASSAQATGFIPVNVQSAPDVHSQGSNTSQLHFLYPNGIQVMCSERVDLKVLKNLINP